MIKEYVSFTCGLMKAKHVICRQFKYASWLYGFNHKNIKSNKQSRSSRGVMNQKEVRKKKKFWLSPTFCTVGQNGFLGWMKKLYLLFNVSLFLKNFLNETRTITKIKMITVCSQILFMLQQPGNFIILWVVQDYYFLFHHFCYGLVQKYNT